MVALETNRLGVVEEVHSGSEIGGIELEKKMRKTGIELSEKIFKRRKNFRRSNEKLNYLVETRN